MIQTASLLHPSWLTSSVPIGAMNVVGTYACRRVPRENPLTVHLGGWRHHSQAPYPLVNPWKILSPGWPSLGRGAATPLPSPALPSPSWARGWGKGGRDWGKGDVSIWLVNTNLSLLPNWLLNIFNNCLNGSAAVRQTMDLKVHGSNPTKWG